MIKRNRLSISFRKEHQYLYDYLSGVSNKSDFVAKALEAYVSGSNQVPLSYEGVTKIIMDILKEQNIMDQASSRALPPPGNEISEEDTNFLSQLF